MIELLDQRRLSQFRKQTQSSLFREVEDYERQLRQDYAKGKESALKELRSINGNLLTNPYKEPGPTEQYAGDATFLAQTLDLFKFNHDFDQIRQELGSTAIFEPWVVNWHADGQFNPVNNGVIALSAFVFQGGESRQELRIPRDAYFYDGYNSDMLDDYDPMWGSGPLIKKPAAYKRSVLEGRNFYVIFFETMPEEFEQPDIKVFIGEDSDNAARTLSDILGIEEEKLKREDERFDTISEIHEANEPIRRRINRIEDSARESRSSYSLAWILSMDREADGYDVDKQRLKKLEDDATKARRSAETEIKNLEKKLQPIPEFTEEPRALELVGTEEQIIELATLFGKSKHGRKTGQGDLLSRSVPLIHTAEFYDYLDTAFWSRTGEFLKKIPSVSAYLNSV